MKKLLIAFALGLVLSIAAQAQVFYIGNNSDGGAGLVTTTTIGGTLGAAAITYYPVLSLPLATTALGVTCAMRVYNVQSFFACLVGFPIELTKAASNGISAGISGKGNYAIIEAAQQDLLNVVAGNDAQYIMVNDLIAYQQEKSQKEQGVSLSTEAAAVQVYNSLETLKN